MTAQEILVHLKGSDSDPKIQAVLSLLHQCVVNAQEDAGRTPNEDRDFDCGGLASLISFQGTLADYIGGNVILANPQQSETNTDNEGNT